MEEEPPPIPKPPDPIENTIYLPVNTQSRKRTIEESVPACNSKKIISDPSAANPSIQTIYIHPSLSDVSKKYTSADKGPFTVHVSREISDPAAGVTIRAIKFGQFLHQNKISGILSDGVKNIGRNKISVNFSTGEDANAFIDNPLLSAAKYKTFIPTFNITRMGLVRGWPVDWSVEEFVSSLVLPAGCGEVLKVRRLNRKQMNDGAVTWVPTQSLVVTFRGQFLPSNIISFYSSLQVETYLFPTIQCMNCCRFGHIKTQCRSKSRCFRCSQEHSGDLCNTLPDLAICILCSGNHFATDKNCTEHSRQQSIKKVMSEENISYFEASSRFPSSRPSYAEIAKFMFPSIPIISKKSQHQSSTQKSYHQTVFRSPRPRPSTSKGYDRQAHRAIVSECPSSRGNGVALNNDHCYAINPLKDNSISLLKESLKNITETFKNTNLPPNVAQIFIQIASFLNSDGSSPTMEH